MITVEDIEKKNFAKAINGYNKDEVDSFLNLIIREIEDLHDEIDKLREKNREFMDRAEAYAEQQRSVTETMKSAKQLLGDISESAERRASLIIKNAESEAKVIVKEAKASVSRSQREAEELRFSVENLRQRYVALLKDTLEGFEGNSSDLIADIEEAFLPASMDETMSKRKKSVKVDFSLPQDDKGKTKVIK